MNYENEVYHFLMQQLIKRMVEEQTKNVKIRRNDFYNPNLCRKDITGEKVTYNIFFAGKFEKIKRVKKLFEYDGDNMRLRDIGILFTYTKEQLIENELPRHKWLLIPGSMEKENLSAESRSVLDIPVEINGINVDKIEIKLDYVDTDYLMRESSVIQTCYMDIIIICNTLTDQAEKFKRILEEMKEAEAGAMRIWDMEYRIERLEKIINSFSAQIGYDKQLHELLKSNQGVRKEPDTGIDVFSR